MRTGELTFHEAKEALEQLYESSDAYRRFILRLYVMYGYNDMYRKSRITPLEGSEDRLFFEENCREMIKMEHTSETLRAELYRELGEFDKCLEYLRSLSPANDYEQKVRIQIEMNAMNKRKEVFLLV